MNKIILFRGKNEMLAPGKAAPLPPTGARMLRLRPPRRTNFVLRAMWRRDPKSGRLECRWLSERGIESEDAASCWQDPIVRRVAAAGAARRISSLSR